MIYRLSAVDRYDISLIGQIYRFGQNRSNIGQISVKIGYIGHIGQISVKFISQISVKSVKFIGPGSFQSISHILEFNWSTLVVYKFSLISYKYNLCFVLCYICCISKIYINFFIIYGLRYITDISPPYRSWRLAVVDRRGTAERYLQHCVWAIITWATSIMGIGSRKPKPN